MGEFDIERQLLNVKINNVHWKLEPASFSAAAELTATGKQ